MTRKMSFVHVWIFAISMLFTLTAIGQTRKISGKVLDNKDSSGISNVSIVAKGSASGTVTDSLGNFSLSLDSSVNVIIVSGVDYTSQEIDIRNKNYLTIFLSTQYASLNDVVVIGYGVAKKIDLTGAIGILPSKDFNKGIFASPDLLLQGKLAGVQIMNNNGQPGGATAIKIRGNAAISGTGQPLFVLDGFPLDGRSFSNESNPLNFINPNDVESITVLKDASATAIYGSRAAYGVIMITTRQGQSGKPKMDVGVSVGLSSILRKISVLNASQYRDAIAYYGTSPQNDKGGDADALNEILQQGLQQNYNLAFSGGNDNGKYRVSFNLLDQQGIIRNTGLKKYGVDLLSKLTFLDSRKLSFDLHILANQYEQNISTSTQGVPDLIPSTLSWNPTDSLKNADGSLHLVPGSRVNPLAITSMVKNNQKLTTILAGISPTYAFNSWLSYKLQLNIQYSTNVARASADQQIFTVNNPVGRASVGNNEMNTVQFTNTFNFQKDIAPGLHLDAVAGTEHMNFSMKGFSATGYGQPGIGFGNFGLDYTNYIQYSNTTDRAISSYIDATSALQSYFARTMFNYRDKYLLTATIRADGSTKFGDNNKYGYFPSVAAAWNISNEPFFKSGFVNTLKLRGSWGITGNQEFPSGSSQAKYSFGNGGTIIQVNNPNPDLQWQSDKQIDIGLDFSLFNNRLSGSIDYYVRKTTNLLFPAPPIQPAPPLSVVRWINLDGSIRNKGLEITLSGNIVKNKDFSWDISANASFLSNNVSDLPSPIYTGWLQGSGVSGTSVEVIQNGLPINAFFTRKYIGVDKATGLSIYEDDGNTFYYVGNPNPKVLAGITNTLRYKQLMLTANFYGAFGQDIFYNTLLNVINVGNMNADRNIALSIYQDPVKESIANPVTPSSRFIYKGNYFKLANLTIEYALRSSLKPFRAAKIFFTGQNLFIITKYPGFDPEANFDARVNNIPSIGIDYAQYPTARTILFGINFSL